MTYPRTHCRRGHPLVLGNTYVTPSTGRRQCLTCRADYNRDPSLSERPFTHCGQGHELTDENTYRSTRDPEYRACRRCNLTRSAAQRRLRGIQSWTPMTHCKRGHPFSLENTIRTTTGRTCRICYGHAKRRKYGITPEQYDSMVASQEGRCAICQRAEPEIGARGLAVDHDHSCCPGNYSCGACVRGLLCSDCNVAIARFADDPARLGAAMNYLRRTPL